MKFVPGNCPECNEPARGTVERLAGVCLFTDQDASGRVEWYGTTDIWWDEQRTEQDAAGHSRLICPDGHEWWAHVHHPELAEA